MKKLLKAPWGISIGTAVFSFILTLGYDLLKVKPVLSTIGIVLQAIWSAILAFLNFELKVWWIILGIIVLFIFLYIWCKISDLKEQEKPDFFNYNEDTFQHWKWSWKWKWNDYEKAWHVADLKAHCPKCNTPMIDQSSYIDFTCPRCNFNATGEKCDMPHKVERVILDNVDRKRQRQEADS